MARLDRLNARLGARRSRLLRAEGLRALGARGAGEARLASLRSGPWAGALPAEGPLPPQAELEAGLRRVLREEGETLLAEAEGAAPRRVLAAFLALDEAGALKALLRGVAAGVQVERILAAAPASERLPEPLRRAVAAAASLDAAVAALAAARHPLAPALAEALPRTDQGGLLPLEAALDRAAFAQAAAVAARGGEDGRMLLDHLAERADAANAGLLLTLAGAGARGADEVGALVRHGGRRLAEDVVVQLAGAPLEEVQAALALAFPGVGAALASPWSAELALEGALLAGARRAARAHPLSAAVPIAYLLDRRAEARRLALLLRGAALELPADELLPLLEMGGAT